MRTAIVIPTFDERANLPSLVDELLATDVWLIIVDGNSPDGTGVVAEAIAADQPRIDVLHEPRHGGLGRSYQAGFERALAEGFDVIVQMDADFSHQPRYVPELVRALDHAEVAIGSRYVAGGGAKAWSLPRRGLSIGANAFARATLGMAQRDLTSGFVAYRRHVLEAIDLNCLGVGDYGAQVELKYRAHRLGFVLVEVPIVFFDRVAGLSKLSRGTIPAAAWRVAQLRLQDL